MWGVDCYSGALGWLTLLLFITYISSTQTPYQALLLRALGGVLIGFFYVNNVLLFFVLFEVSLIPLLVYILGSGSNPERVRARYYFMLYTCMASFPLFFNIVAQE